MEIEIVCEDEKYIPAYANETDACMDLKIKAPKKGYVLTPNSNVVLGTGIKVKVPEDYVMQIYPRSSTGIKMNCMLSNTTGIIDAGYRDEIKMALHNFGDKSIILEDGQRVAQFMIVPRPKLELKVVPDNQQFRIGDRKGGIGSTGK